MFPSLKQARVLQVGGDPVAVMLTPAVPASSQAQLIQALALHQLLDVLPMLVAAITERSIAKSAEGDITDRLPGQEPPGNVNDWLQQQMATQQGQAALQACRDSLAASGHDVPFASLLADVREVRQECSSHFSSFASNKDVHLRGRGARVQVCGYQHVRKWTSERGIPLLR